MMAARKEEQTPQNARNVELLLHALKYIINMPDTPALSPDECSHIESLINDRRKKIFYEKWAPMEPRHEGQESFFCRYIRHSMLKYKPKKYEGQFSTITKWIEYPEGPMAKVRALSALSDIQLQLMIDAG